MTVAAVIVGPKILLLLPVWLMGVWAYSVSKRCTFKPTTSLFLFIGSILVYVAMRAFELPLRLGWHTAAFFGADVYEQSFAESRNFLFSYVAGVLVTANFIAFHSLSKSIVLKKIPFERTIRFLASYTFTLYLLHYPLLNFFVTILNSDPTRFFDQFLLFMFMLVTVYLIGGLTEHKKMFWRVLLDRMVNRFFLIQRSS